MKHDLTIIALVGLALGARSLLSYLSRKAAPRSDPLQTWENEGGAVPVAPNRTAAQTAPYDA